ncbi:MAG: hypothetical protein WKG07_18585 [Hymenobacter sp.]
MAQAQALGQGRARPAVAVEARLIGGAGGGSAAPRRSCWSVTSRWLAL